MKWRPFVGEEEMLKSNRKGKEKRQVKWEESMLETEKFMENLMA